MGSRYFKELAPNSVLGYGRKWRKTNIKELLEPFYQRASEAEDRLSKLEAALSISNSGNQELQSKLPHEETQREKAQKDIQKLTMENAKLQYRVTHLVRALKEADRKLEVE